MRSRLDRALIDRVDAWILRQPEPRPSRSEAIRRLVEKALGGGEPSVRRLDLENGEWPGDWVRRA